MDETRQHHVLPFGDSALVLRTANLLAELVETRDVAVLHVLDRVVEAVEGAELDASLLRRVDELFLDNVPGRGHIDTAQ